MDVWGAFFTPTINGQKFFLTIVDEFSRNTWLFLMTNKLETSRIIIQFLNFIKNQFNITPKIIRTDNGKEFINETTKNIFSSKGIIHQMTCPYTPNKMGWQSASINTCFK